MSDTQDTTTVIDGTTIESKSNTGPKKVYQLSKNQKFANSVGYSSNDYSEFFISCAMKAKIPMGDTKIIKQMYKDTVTIIEQKFPEIYFEDAASDKYKKGIKQKIKQFSGLDDKLIKTFMSNNKTIRDDITRTTPAIPFDHTEIAEGTSWEQKWEYFKTTQVGDLYKVLLTSEWIGLIVDDDYHDYNNYMQGLNYQAGWLIHFCNSIEEAFVLLFWIRYKETDSIYKNIFTGLVTKQIWHIWTVAQMLMKKHHKIFQDYRKLQDKQIINFPFICLPMLSSILRLDNVKVGRVSPFNKELIKTYFRTIFSYGSEGVLIFAYTLYNKALKSDPPHFLYTSNDQGDTTIDLNETKITNLLTQDLMETLTIDEVEIFKGKEYFDKHKKKIGKLYKSKHSKQNWCPDFEVPKGKNFLGKIMGGRKKKKRRKFTKKEWIKIKRKRTLKKY